ncbi:unnamed protein product [Phyllotreta striolata]|uniref:VWFA domain-containing protein n=1 Tax=Phyllotreta striolata TaxID=444603 RepID=A0A9N9TWZ1_PHYSR|nr:unnamed protein product [Phyllotreta striolata]
MIVLVLAASGAADERKRMEKVKQLVRFWSKRIGEKLTELSKKMTREDQVEDSFRILEDKLIKEDDKDLVNDIADDIKKMMKKKEEAVFNIAEYMEFISYHRDLTPIFENSSYYFFDADNITDTEPTDKRLEELHATILNNECHWKCEQPCNSTLKRNAFSDCSVRLKLFAPRDNEQSKECNCAHLPEKDRPPDTYRHLPLRYDPRYDEHVNLDLSVAKLAINVYEREHTVLEGIRWSEALDLVFKENLNNDPTLTWQYFASPKGFMRHYPAMKWSEEQYKQTYDFRLRTWYTEAFTSPKDLILLLDRSGSMIGTRRAVSDQIVNQILDTLNDNDFVNVYTFTNTTEPLINCFNDTLVQANEENLRLLREAIPVYEEEYVADLSLGINKAFDILENFRKTRSSANCNQAIMLITEGIDYYYDKDIFKRRNWDKDYPVRIFTYQIGQDEGDAVEMEWIACNNMGWWGNMSVMGDIREKMIHYLNVMSRPINLGLDKKRSHIWSYLHVDLADRRLSNWLWKKFEGIRQRNIYLDHIKRIVYRQNQMLTAEDHMLLKETHPYKAYEDKMDYKYMTTVSLPVFGRNINETELLGVAGVDVPLKLFKSLIPYERLGVNGYAFIVTNNGYILMHPDHKSEFQTILKPTFNRVDILEVEILNDDREPRLFGDSVVKFRDKLVNQRSNEPVILKVKYTLNDNKRLMLGCRHYYFAPIGPFTLGVVLPDKYGFDIVNKTLIDRPDPIDSAASLNSRFWKVHPDWIYCKKCVGDSPEDRVRDGFSKNENTSLLTSLLYDMEATKWFDDYGDADADEEKFIVAYQVHKVFLATYSGLTRWRDFEDISSVREDVEDSFEKRNDRAIDEDWYRRAVELNFEDESKFIYSVPFETSGYENNTMITSTKAIFVEKGDLKSPVAVVGLQFNHREMYEWYNDITTTCNESRCKITCKQKDLNCYIMDNNAYIVLSDEPEFIGRYMGDIRPDIMADLIQDRIYIPTKMYDYQAICQKVPPKKEPETVRIQKRKQKEAMKKKKKKTKRSTSSARSSAARGIIQLANNLLCIKDWLIGLLVVLKNAVTGEEVQEVYNSTRDEYLAFNKLMIEKTVPTPCDQSRWLFNLNKTARFPFSNYTKDGTKFQCSWPYAIDKIPNTNLLFLATNDGDGACRGRSHPIYSTEPKEIIYNTTLPCYIATMNNYTRRMYMNCYERNKKEDDINKYDHWKCGHYWK